MQLTFNPMVPAEADFVRRMLTPGDVAARTTAILSAIAPEDRPDVGAETPPVGPSIKELQAGGHLPESAVPLPPSAPSAPSTAAADLFSNAPAAPVAGIPMPPGAALPPVPSVPAVPPVPTAPATPTSPATAADLDADGLPWNAEIHSGNKAKNADGRWRQRRNLDPAVLERVTAQLRALMALPAPGAVSVIPAAPSGATPSVGPAVASVTSTPTPVAALPATAPAAVPAPPVSVSTASPVIPPAPAVSVPPPPAVAPAPIAAPPAALDTPAAPASFAVVLRWVTDSLAARKITEADVNQALADIGGVQIGQLAARPDLLAEFHRNLQAKVPA